jgi:hypothetical protein
MNAFGLGAVKSKTAENSLLKFNADDDLTSMVPMAPGMTVLEVVPSEVPAASPPAAPYWVAPNELVAKSTFALVLAVGMPIFAAAVSTILELVAMFPFVKPVPPVGPIPVGLKPLENPPFPLNVDPVVTVCMVFPTPLVAPFKAESPAPEVLPPAFPKLVTTVVSLSEVEPNLTAIEVSGMLTPEEAVFEVDPWPWTLAFPVEAPIAWRVRRFFCWSERERVTKGASLGESVYLIVVRIMTVLFHP